MLRELFLLSALMFLAASAWAEGQKPSEFFDQNFVNQAEKRSDPLVEGEPIAKPAENKNQPNSNTQATQIEADPFAEIAAPDEPTAAPAAAEPDAFAAGTPVISLGAVIENQDPKHFQAEIRKMVELSESTGIKLGLVYLTSSSAVPPTREFMLDQRKFMANGGRIKLSREAIERFKVTRSPSYLVETKDGIVVLEGVSNLRRYFNQKGELLSE